jgi:hypothetical protein
MREQTAPNGTAHGLLLPGVARGLDLSSLAGTALNEYKRATLRLV